jgi:hypothetical protein
MRHAPCAMLFALYSMPSVIREPIGSHMTNLNYRNQVDEIQLKIYREMSPENKLDIAILLYHTARSLKKIALQNQHPEWSDVQISQELRKIFFYART